MTSELMAKLLFVLYGLIVLGGGVMAVGSASLVRALVGLILTLFGVAGMYLLMAAPFMALMQLLIYVGAVVVLIFFAIMLTRASGKADMRASNEPRPSGGKTVLALLAGLLPAGGLALLCLSLGPAGKSIPETVTIDVLGRSLMTEYVLAFELISVVLFVAMAGAVLLGFERRGGK